MNDFVGGFLEFPVHKLGEAETTAKPVVYCQKNSDHSSRDCFRLIYASNKTVQFGLAFTTISCALYWCGFGCYLKPSPAQTENEEE